MSCITKLTLPPLCQTSAMQSSWADHLSDNLLKNCSVLSLSIGGKCGQINM